MNLREYHQSGEKRRNFNIDGNFDAENSVCDNKTIKPILGFNKLKPYAIPAIQS